MSEQSRDGVGEGKPEQLEQKEIILGLGCSMASRAFRSMDLELKMVRSLRQLLKPNETFLRARVIAVHVQSLKEHSVSSGVRALRRHYPLIDVVIWAPGAQPTQVREALRAGARDVELSERPEDLVASVGQVIDEQQLLPRVQELQEALPTRTRFEELRSRSRKMWDLFETAAQIAPTPTSVLILGETGTGKELFARALHARSGRKGHFVAVNCGAIPEHLIDSELFGHVKGAFTGAMTQKQGLFRFAEGGTLFLDELGNIPLDVQFRLLRVLQEGQIRQVGGHQEIPVDVRVVAATNADIEGMVESGQFREDLYYRLDVLRLEIPPLRERPEDILFLLSIFMRELVEQYQSKRPQLQEEFVEQVLSYDWPGNVRELENMAERLVLLYSQQRIGREHFLRLTRSSEPSAALVEPAQSQVADFEASGEESPNERLPVKVDASLTLSENIQPMVERIERMYLEACLTENAGRIGDTALQAGINRRTLLRKLKAYGIDKMDYRKRRR